MTVSTMPIEDNFKAICQWHTEAAEQERGARQLPKGKALLKVVSTPGGGLKLENAHRSDISLWQRFLSFFGMGNYALEKVTSVVRETLKSRAAQADEIVRHWNQKILKFSGKHSFRFVEMISLTGEGPTRGAKRGSKSRSLDLPPPSDRLSDDEFEKYLDSSSTDQPYTPRMGRIDRTDTLESLCAKATKGLPDVAEQLEQKREEAASETVPEKLGRIESEISGLERRQRDLINEMEGYHRLAAYFFGATVRGEGYCLYRAFAAALLQNGNLDELETKIHTAVIEKKHAGIDQLFEEDTSRRDSYNQALDSLEQLKAGTSLETVMNNRVFSDSWIRLLRLFAINPWRARLCTTAGKDQNAKQNLIRLVMEAGAAPENANADENWEEWQARVQWEKVFSYLDDHEQMRPGAWGGQIEIDGICQALNISICVLNVLPTGTLKQIRFEAHNCSEAHISDQKPYPKADVYLFFDGQHYNAAFPREET